MTRYALAALLLAAAAARGGPPLPPSYDDACLRSVQFVDANEGWAAGDDGVIWHSTDGGRTWERQKTGTRASLRWVQFLTPYTGFVAGRMERPEGSVGVLLKTTDGGLTWADTLSGDLPGLMAIKFFDETTGYAAGDGCDAFPSGLFVTKDGGTTWAALPGPRVPGWTGCDFTDTKTGTLTGRWNTIGKIADGKLTVASGTTDDRCRATHGTTVWTAGSPGSVVLTSADAGKTWTPRPTGVALPIRGMCLVSPMVGYAVGEFGTILATTDGGQTWAVRKNGGQRAAILCISTSNAGVPLAMMPTMGAVDGYLVAALTVTSPDPATASPTTATAGERLLAAVRMSGGAAADALAFPLPAHRLELPAEKQFDAATREQMTRAIVLAVRTWRPEVVVTDFPGVAEAAKLAADPVAFPDQLAQSKLTPHTVRKVYAAGGAAKTDIRYDVHSYRADIGDSLSESTAAAAHLLGRSPDVAGMYRRIDAANDAQAIADGLDLARGGTARRAIALAPSSPAFVAARETVLRSRKAMFDVLAATEKDADWDTTQSKLTDTLKEIPDDDAVECLTGFARQAAAAGKWTVAREVYAFAAQRYGTRPATAEAFRWLMRYHASGEAIRRLELGQQPTLRPTTFFKMPAVPASEVVQVGYYAPPAGPKVKFRSAEVESKWVAFGAELEPALFAVSPLAAREPATRLGLAASLQRLGRNADAERDLTMYRRTVAAGTGHVWFDAVAAELWVANRGNPCPKPVAACGPAIEKPKLDGKLDDACWQTAKLLDLPAPATHPTTARYAYDAEYLYVAVTCGHPAGAQVPKSDGRKRDEDLSGHDRVELMLDIDRDFSTYYRLRVDHRGCVADDCWGDSTWNPTWFVAVEPNATGWTMEAAIPLAELTGSRPRAGAVWAMNAMRVIPGTGVYGWSQPVDATPRPEGMGLIEFMR